MVSFKVHFSDKALEQVESYVSYVFNDLRSPQAAKAIWEDAMITSNQLESSAELHRLCENECLRELGYRLIHFRAHRYLYVYRIIGDTAYIEAAYHELQDYENLFESSLE